ncbi:cobyric acid synthase [Geomonas sp. Red875]|uniref:Cobyric acid synthase n=2 Tax=Geomesophilobacter sediminis TaxID=2798584 RepID=A0A8J7JM07_9BACT|nr:cobyric acid synthase [Geomesophilobacter sediminis]
MLQHPIDMFSIVIVGNSATRLLRDGRILTPRGYTTDGSHRTRSRKADVDAATMASANSVGAPFLARTDAVDRAGNGAPTVDATAAAEGLEPTLTSGSADRGRNAAPTGVAAASATDSPRPQTRDPRSPVSPRAVMFCGTGSDVGKSVLAAGFCRVLKRRGIAVAPFKSQNMALNSAVTPEGGEIGRAQAVQAEACGIEPHTDMNPVLLKPNSDLGSQVIVQGRVVGNMAVKQYHQYKPVAFEKVRESFERLKSRYSFVVMEGAGSIAEVNLKAHDIANLKAAEMAGAPAILIADIDRGGVFAQIVGTFELLEPAERAQVKGIVINKFRGDASLLKSGIDLVEAKTGVPVLGVVPWFTGFAVPEEDSVALRKRSTRPGASAAPLKIGVVRLGRISNYTDFAALEREPDVELCYLDAPEGLDRFDLVVIPGTKSTIADLNSMREVGFFDAIRGYRGMIAGICGGYQILGTCVADPERVESDVDEATGLGLLDVQTTLIGSKKTHRVTGRLTDAGLAVAPGCGPDVAGYEIHMGETTLGPHAAPFATLAERSGAAVTLGDGAVSEDGRVFGTYLHGIFDNHGFRTALLNRLRRARGVAEREATVAGTDPLDQLADHLEKHLDLERIFTICGEPVAGCLG